MKAIIMAGGQGIRLRPLTCSVPKPLSLLCGSPVVYYILDLLEEHGFDEAVFTVGYKSEQLERLFETGRYKNINLRFSREDSPLGTAGCVKRAVGGRRGFDDDFLVISGDALCDFDLSAAVKYHKDASAKATVITKRVEDPREYGLVLTEVSQNTEKSEESPEHARNNGLITGFSEKPSYLSCMGDCANTGVYVLSPEVMSLIPDGVAGDFARDVFPKMLGSEMPLHAYEETGYWCDIGDFSTYAKSQLDILSGKVKCRIDGRKIADGIYSKSEIPAHVSVKSPCYIGENVTFSDGANGHIHLSESVICDNVNIGSNTKVRSSVILDSAFLSDGVTANGSIICKGAKLLHSAGAYEGSVIGEGCLIGREAIVSGGVKIWNEKTIPPGANVTRDVKYGLKTGAELSEKGVTGETNADITPELCARLGAALVEILSPSDFKKIAVSCEDNAASAAMKHAIMAGASGAGGEVFDIGAVPPSRLMYAAGLLNCGVTAWVKCGIFADIEILGANGLHLTRQEERRLEAALSRSEYKNADWNGFGEIHNFGGGGFDSLYTSMLYGMVGFKSRYQLKLNCNNERVTRSLAPIFDAVSAKNAEILVVTLTANGTKAEFYTENNTKIGYEQLLLLAAAAVMKSGLDAALPNDFAACADFLAASYGRTVHRYFLCTNDSCDEHARYLAARQPFLRDGAILALDVLRYISDGGMSVEDAVKSIPQFASERREVEINCPPQRIISRLCDSGTGKGEGVLVGDNRESVLIRSAKRGNSLFLLAESLSNETAAQLCDNAESLIKKIMSDM